MSPLTGKGTAVGVAHRIQSVHGSQHSHPQLRGAQSSHSWVEFDLAFHSSQKRVRKTHTQGELKVHKWGMKLIKLSTEFIPDQGKGDKAVQLLRRQKPLLGHWSHLLISPPRSPYPLQLYCIFWWFYYVAYPPSYSPTLSCILYSILYSIVCQCIILTQSSAIHDFYSFALFFSLFLYPFLLLLCLSKPPNLPGLYLGI